MWSAEAIASAFEFTRWRAEASESESGGDASALQMALRRSHARDDSLLLDFPLRASVSWLRKLLSR
jgi:hypothetical protein